MTIRSWRLPWICLAAAVPALAGHELWSGVQGIAAGARIEVQLKGAKHRGVLSAVTETSLSINTGTAQMSFSRPEIRKVKVRKSNFVRRSIIGGIIGAAAGIAASAPFSVLAANEGNSDQASIIAAGAAIGLGIGAGLGALAALAPGYYTVYESSTGP
ncbi:MAG TPA: hypothetical protein VLN48_04480 [Bryobacteraceae bacterium]|nr:hypothetical protein [Bryobacteraceae bacterium]